MTIGIDKIGFATGRYRLDMENLAQSRGVDADKFSKGLLLDALSITPITDDIVTLGASAANSILTEDDKAMIDMIIVATESSIDQSKAAAVYIHKLLGIQPFARSLEFKEACYSATAALNYAKLHVEKHKKAKVLVIASDIAKYGINTPGEPTQGSGSVAMLVSQNPRLLEIHDDNVAQTRDIMDFWRPNYSTTPFVDGMYSTKQYLDMLKTTWAEYQKRSGKTLADFSAFCFHLPFPKLALKGLHKIMDKRLPDRKKETLKANFDASIIYSRQIGNIYTGSLFLGLLSLLENSNSLQGGEQIALFSYGSGAVAEIFSATLVSDFKKQLQTNRKEQLNQRQSISVADYEKLFFEEATLDAFGNANFANYATNDFYLSAIKEHQRIYEAKHG
ncbi:hydroxymethylglutaryl-CoA synthase [Streptococcus sciuri]|uniref:Hydroxymethylglutaryl-CoA synthase n=1 Tax=Streptococcus sciuri TaxID=2973939 RepID=A0ABT2F4U1_9STRE|nr:hydroxymethylglutaryl-CoA synthase [Streptococcus sciuri]MCS4487400.1 hydroxymethylglutaryl-CoA synthase [Streptococcus sciuri]